jgi:MFS family permease
VRLIAGKASDRYGRKEVLLVSTAIATLGMVVLGLSVTPFHLLIAVAIYGLAHGMTSPTLFAWATDLSDPENRGKGISTLYIFMELGIGIGALAGGFIYGNDATHFMISFLVCAFLTMMAFIYLVSLKLRSNRIA